MNKLVTSLIAGMAAALAIGILAYADVAQDTMILIMAPFGASAVLVFGVPDSPLAQPKNVILGHLLTAFVGIVFTQYIGVNPLTMAVATGLGITGMLATNTTHPPAGANPMLIMMAGQGWSFLITPVLLGSVAIVAVGMAYRKLRKELAIA